MIGAWIRRTGFWFLDLIKGRPIGKHYNNVKAIMEGQCEETNQPLTALLRHTIDTVPYYKNISEPVLAMFPVVNKTIYKQDIEAFHSTSYIDQELHKVTTSGSTGTPFEAVQDEDKQRRNFADLIYHHQIRGWEIGDRFIYLHGWGPDEEKSAMANFKQNSIPFNVLHFNDGEKEKVRTHLKRDKCVTVILGYASALELLVNYMLDKDDNSSMFNIKVIFSDSDTLTNTTRNKLEEMFACPVCDRYSNEEQGILACSKPYENIYYINRASYYIELLKLDNDKPAAPGEIGRVVVTDLYNKGMPFIRYDVGDLAISEEADRANLTILHSLQGRRSDMIFDTNGNMMTEVVLNECFDELQKAKQYQFIQNSKNEYLLKLNCDSDVYDTNDIVNELKGYLGNDAIISVEFVDDIPVAKTGKYQAIINNQPSQDRQI